MAAVTYYVVLPFVRNEDGDLIVEEGIEAQSASSARSKAALLASTKAGVIAFQRTGDPTIGEFEPAIVIARHGDTPDELE